MKLFMLLSLFFVSQNIIAGECNFKGYGLAAGQLREVILEKSIVLTTFGECLQVASEYLNLNLDVERKVGYKVKRKAIISTMIKVVRVKFAQGDSIFKAKLKTN